jgi:hypothetical protein
MASITPSLIALATIYSVSSTLSKESLVIISLIEILE